MKTDPKLWEYRKDWPDSPELEAELKKGLRDVLLILAMMIAMIWLFVYVALNAEAVDTLAEFYQSEVCSFILDHQLETAIACLLIAFLGCVWKAKRK